METILSYYIIYPCSSLSNKNLDEDTESNYSNSNAIIRDLDELHFPTGPDPDIGVRTVQNVKGNRIIGFSARCSSHRFVHCSFSFDSSFRSLRSLLLPANSPPEEEIQRCSDGMGYGVGERSLIFDLLREVHQTVP